jgi:hypothetical protein
MTFSPTTDNNILKLLLNATNWASIADNTVTSPLTNIYVSLHTADPTAGSQTTSEVTYTSYARVAVARTTGGWTASTVGSSSPVAAITFPAGIGGSGTATYMGIGTLATTAGVLLGAGAISPSIVTGNGVTPQLTTATTIVLT